jgi:hypothetical protein
MINSRRKRGGKSRRRKVPLSVIFGRKMSKRKRLQQWKILKRKTKRMRRKTGKKKRRKTKRKRKRMRGG